METRANYALIGVFTLAVIATAFLFVYWFSGGDTGAAPAAGPGRVLRLGSGLSKGSIVTFNGPQGRGDEARPRGYEPGRRRGRGRPHDADPHRHPGEARAPGPHRGRDRSLSSAATPALRRSRRRPGSSFRRFLPIGPTSRTSWRRRARSRGGPTTCSSASARSSPTTKARSTAPSPMSSASRWR